MTPTVRQTRLDDNQRQLQTAGDDLAGAAAGFVYGAKTAVKQGNLPAADAELDLAAAALPNPTPEKIRQAEERVTNHSAEDYEKAWAELQQLRENQTRLIQEREVLHQEYEAALSEKLALEQKLRAAATSRAALLKTVIHTLMVLGAATAIASVLAFRFFKSLAAPLAILSGAAFGLAYLAAIIQPWMVYTIGGLLVVLGAAFGFYTYRERRIADGAVGFIQEERNGDEQWWQSKKQAAQDWLGHPKGWLGKEIDRRTSEMNLS